ncbi:hypothetical protein ABT234_36415 [Streptomyces sp. NPDC001586]
MGHSTARAALIYQHASADALSGLVQAGRKGAKGQLGRTAEADG